MLSSYFPAALRSLQCLQSGFPPVPARLFSRSMLLPSVHAVLLWCTFCLIECHGLVVGIRRTSSWNRLMQHNTDVKRGQFQDSCMGWEADFMMRAEVGDVVRPSKWHFAAYGLMVPAGDVADEFFLKALHDADIARIKSYEWGFSDIEDIGWNGRQFVFGYLFKNKPVSERSRIDKEERVTRVEPLDDDLLARSAFFVLPNKHLIAFHPQSTDIPADKFYEVFAKLVESTSPIGFVSVSFVPITETEDIFEAISAFSTIERLEIDVILPNPRLNPRWKGIKDDIEGVGAEKYEQKYVAPEDGSLRIGDDTRAHRSIEMASDGYGEARLDGLDAVGTRRKASTREYPATIQAPSVEATDKETVLEILVRKFDEILARADRQ